MRDLFILALEKLIAVIIVVLMIAVVVGAVATMGSAQGGVTKDWGS